MSAAQAFTTKKRSKIGFSHAEKAVKVNENFFQKFYEKDFVNANYS